MGTGLWGSGRFHGVDGLAGCGDGGLVLQRRQGGVSEVFCAVWRRLWWESLACSLRSCVCHRSNSTELLLGSGYTWGRVGASPPSLLQAQQESSPSRHRARVMPPGPGAGLVLVQPHVALLGLGLVPAPSHVRCLQGCVLGSVGQVGGFAAPGSGARWPSGVRRACAGWWAAPLGKL